MVSVVHDVVEFLRLHPPFDGLPVSEVERAAAGTEVEFHRAGSVIFEQGDGTNEYLRVIRTGEVEILNDGRILDQLGAGEMFGHASMLSGLPPGFSARAVEDTLVYRIPAETAYSLLGNRASLRYVARSLLEDRYRLASRHTVRLYRGSSQQRWPHGQHAEPGNLHPAEPTGVDCLERTGICCWRHGNRPELGG